MGARPPPFNASFLPLPSAAECTQAAELLLTHCSYSYAGRFPDNVRFKKTIPFGLLGLKLGVSCNFDLHSGVVSPKISAKDLILKGKFELNVPARAVEYRKRFHVPLGPVKGCLLVAGTWCWDTPHRRPRVFCSVELGDWMRTLVRPLCFNLRPTLPLTSRIGLKANSQLSFKLPRQLQLWRDDSQEQQQQQLGADGWHDGDVAAGAGDRFGVRLHVTKLDLVFRL